MMNRFYQLILPYICIVLFSFNISAQDFMYKSILTDVKKDDFYDIILPPEIVAHCNTHFQDLRLFDQHGKEIAYIMNPNKEYNLSNFSFTAYKILSSTKDDKQQTFVIERPDNSLIESFIVKMRNANIVRPIKISGSNDNINWYAVKDEFYFCNFENQSTTDGIIDRALTFPPINYSYFKITIQLKNKDPLDIIKVGNYNQFYKHLLYTKIDGITFSKLDSNKHSYITVQLPLANRIDKLDFDITSPDLYFRQVKIKSPNTTATQQKNYSIHKSYRDINESALIHSSTLSSKEANSITLDNTGKKWRKLLITVDNEDNEPLNIGQIIAYQQLTSIKAKLKSNTHYTLYYGDSLLSLPSYDLNYFSNDLPSTTNVLTAGKVLLKEEKVAAAYDTNQDKYIVWVGLFVIVLLIVFITRQMMKEK